MSTLRVSPATIDDYADCARLFTELEVPELPWSAERFAEVVVPDAIVLRSDEARVGYAWARPRGNVFHVLHVVVDPRCRRRGAGRLMMTTLAARARALGFSRWMLNTKPENVVAQALYEQFGMSVALASALVQLPWPNVERLQDAPDVHARELTPEDDAAFERTFHLAPGELASLRAMQKHLFGVERAQGPVAFGAFDRESSGISPIRVGGPSFVRALLEAVRPLAEETQTHARVFAEGDPALEAALTRAGGEVVIRVIRMQGDVPSPSENR